MWTAKVRVARKTMCSLSKAFNWSWHIHTRTRERNSRSFPRFGCWLIGLGVPFMDLETSRKRYLRTTLSVSAQSGPRWSISFGFLADHPSPPPYFRRNRNLRNRKNRRKQGGVIKENEGNNGGQEVLLPFTLFRLEISRPHVVTSNLAKHSEVNTRNLRGKREVEKFWVAERVSSGELKS